MTIDRNESESLPIFFITFILYQTITRIQLNFGLTMYALCGNCPVPTAKGNPAVVFTVSTTNRKLPLIELATLAVDGSWESNVPEAFL